MPVAESPPSLTRVARAALGARSAAAAAEAAHAAPSARPHFHFNLNLMNAKKVLAEN